MLPHKDDFHNNKDFHEGMKVTLKCEYNYPEQIPHTIEHTFREPGIEDMLECFEMFMKGSGFNFNGKLDIVNEEE